MILPKLNIINTSRDMVDIFGGYNHNLRIASNEFYDMENMTSTNYPTLSPRGVRGEYELTPEGTCGGIISKDALCYIDGKKFVISGCPVEGMELGDYTTASLVSMGAYVIIRTRNEKGKLVDKKWVNTLDQSYGDIDAEFKPKPNDNDNITITITLCDINAADYAVEMGPTAPEIPEKKEDTENETENTENEEEKIPYWIDTSSKPYTLKQYSINQGYWVSMPTTYLKLTCPGIDENFNVYDGIEITGISDSEYADTLSSTAIWAKGDGYIVVPGMLGDSSELKVTSIKREMPDMDFVIESGNRLWGCKYGMTEDGTPINEIYASKLGDFKNWKCFMGISTDSYAASCGTDGHFTGAITHLGYPLFFKEHCLHKVYGNYPANYQIQVTECRGVEQYSHKSLAIVNETLFYKSRSGICAYDGSLPVEVSSAFGDEVYHNAVAGALGNKYYVSMKDKEDRAHLFVYDMARGVWHREDGLYPTVMCPHKGDLYYIVDGKIGTILGAGTKDTEPVKWHVVSGTMGLDSPDRKFISRLSIRMSLAIGATASIFAEYDSSGEWEFIGSLTGKSLQTFTLPILPRRCDHFRLKIEGSGDARIYSITKTTEGGSSVG